MSHINTKTVAAVALATPFMLSFASASSVSTGTRQDAPPVCAEYEGAFDAFAVSAAITRSGVIGEAKMSPPPVEIGDFYHYNEASPELTQLLKNPDLVKRLAESKPVLEKLFPGANFGLDWIMDPEGDGRVQMLVIAFCKGTPEITAPSLYQLDLMRADWESSVKRIMFFSVECV